jgi:hypothetical protein
MATQRNAVSFTCLGGIEAPDYNGNAQLEKAGHSTSMGFSFAFSGGFEHYQDLTSIDMPHSSKLIELVRPALVANSPCRGQVKRTMPTPEQIRKCSEGGHMFARIVQITAKPGQGPNLSQHTKDRTINVLKPQPGFIDMLVVKSDTNPN